MENEKSSLSLQRGSLVDILVLTPDEFDEHFIVKDIEVPSQPIVAILKQLKDEYDKIPVMDLAQRVLEIAREHNYRNSNKDDVVMKYVWVDVQDYWNAIVEADSRTILAKEEYEFCKTVADNLKESPFVKQHLFNSEHKCVQCELYWEHKGYKLKALLDKVIFDEENKIIYPYDLKTTGTSNLRKNFIESNSSPFWRFRYDIQASFYTEGLKATYPEYSIHPFRLVVESLEYPGIPRIYELDDTILSIGKNGGTHEGKTYEGWEDALTKLKWHEENDIWEYEQEEYENGGIIKVTAGL